MLAQERVPNLIEPTLLSQFSSHGASPHHEFVVSEKIGEPEVLRTPLPPPSELAGSAVLEIGLGDGKAVARLLKHAQTTAGIIGRILTRDENAP